MITNADVSIAYVLVALFRNIKRVRLSAALGLAVAGNYYLAAIQRVVGFGFCTCQRKCYVSFAPVIRAWHS